MSFDGELYNLDPYSGKRKRAESRRFGPCACGCVLLILGLLGVFCLLVGTLLGVVGNEVVNNNNFRLETQLAAALTQTSMVIPTTAVPVMIPPTLPPSETPTPTETPTVTPLPTNTISPTPVTPTLTPTLTAIAHSLNPPPIQADARLLENQILWSPNGRMLAVAGGEEVRLFNIGALGAEGVPLTGGLGDIQDIAFNGDGSRLAVARADGKLQLWDTESAATPRQVAELAGASGPLWSVAFDPFNQWVAAGTDDGKVRFWRAGDQVAIYTYQATIGPIFALAFSADGTRLAIGGEQQVALFEIRQVSDGLELENSIPLTIAGRVLNLAFNPNGKYLAIASDRASNELEFWRLDPLLRIALNGHQASITDITFSADGIILASASRDETVRLWIINEITNSADEWHILVHRSAVISLAFNPDNTQLATLSLNGTVTLWNVAEGEAVAERLP